MKTTRFENVGVFIREKIVSETSACTIQTPWNYPEESVRQMTRSFVMSVRLSAWNSASAGRIFMKFGV